MNKVLIIFTISILSLGLKAQDLNTHYLYQMNWYNINPAYSAQTEGIKTLINPGTQWVGIEGSPTNSMFGIHSRIDDNIGAGGKIIIDKRGLFSNFTAELTGSYEVKLTDEHILNFGVSAGLFQNNLNEGSIISDIYTDAKDVTLTNGFFNQTQFLSSFGVLYQFNNLEIAASLPHMVVTGRPISDHFFGMAKYNFFLKDDIIKVSPSVVFQNLTLSPNLIDVGVTGEWKETVWLKTVYRTNKSVVVATGLNWDKLGFGYAFNIYQTPLSNISRGSHEILLTYTFDKKSKGLSEADRAATKEIQQNAEYIKDIVKELNKMNDTNSDTEADQKKVKDLNNELEELIKKVNNKTATDNDYARIQEIEKEIQTLMKKYEK